MSDVLQTEALERIVTQAGAEIDRHVVETLHAKYGLTSHCDALKRYVLLGQVRKLTHGTDLSI